MGSLQDLSFLLETRGRRIQRKGKEAEEEAETDAASYSRNPHQRQPAWSQWPTDPVNQTLGDKKAVPRENKMEMSLAEGLARCESHGCLFSAMLFTALRLKVSEGSCKWRWRDLTQ